MLDFFSINIYFYLAVIFILGLIVGSFLNVVIYRFPLMMKRQWEQQCEEYCRELACNVSNPPLDKNVKFAEELNIAWPASHCPHCKAKLSPWQNIPILSFILLRGKCANCHAKISWQYPLVELSSAILAVLVFFHFGLSVTTFFGVVLTWVLIALTVIDLQHQLLPDDLTLPFLWLGLIINIFHVFTDSTSAILGAACGYLSLWSVNQIFKLITKKEGMGYGDFKLFALFGAWFGWQILPFTILIAAGVGTIVGLFLILFRGHDRHLPIPFGPYLAAAGWIGMMWGHEIVLWYLRVNRITG